MKNGHGHARGHVHDELTDFYWLCKKSNVVFLGVAIGGPLLGWLAHRITNRRAFFGGSSVLVAVFFSIVLWFPSMPMGWLITCLLCTGVFASGYILIFGVGNEVVSSENQGSAMGFINMLSVIPTPLLQPLIGGILTAMVGRHVASNLLTVPIRDFQVALMVLPLLALCACVLALKLPQK